MSLRKMGTFAKSVVIAGILATTFFAKPATRQSNIEEVKFGLLPGLALYLPLWVAQDKGFFAEEKVKPTFISVGGGGAQTMAALLGGSFDMTDLSLPALAAANERVRICVSSRATTLVFHTRCRCAATCPSLWLPTDILRSCISCAGREWPRARSDRTPM